MLQGFKQFILRGNVLDLAVAVVMGVAFGAVVTALVKDIITPFIAAIVGKPDFSAIGIHDQWEQIPDRRLHQRGNLVHPNRCRRIFLHRTADEHTSRPNAARGSGSRPDYQKMPGVSKRRANSSTPLRLLHLPTHRSYDTLRNTVSRGAVS